MNLRGLLVFLLTLCGAAQAEPASITLSLADDNALMVRYRFPAGASILRFAMQDALAWERVRKPHWRVLEDCAVLEPQGLRRNSLQGCEVATVRVEPGLLRLDRRFEPAQSIGDGALALHTRYYAVQGVDPATHWAVRAPAGGTAFWLGQERPGGGEVQVPTPATGLQAQIDDTTVVLSRRPFEQWRGIRALTAGLPDQQGNEVRAAVEALLAEYRHNFGPPAGDPLLVAVGLPLRDAAVARPRGDVQDGAVRMTLEYSGKMSNSDRGALRVFLAHELFHLWHGRRFHAAGEAWLGEGNADWIALNTLHRLGWMNDSVYVTLLEQAFNECAAGIGPQPWRNAPQRQAGTLPYRCGLAFHAMAFEAARREGNSTAPLDQWRAILSGGRPVTEAAFFGWYGRADFGGARLDALRALLADDAPFASGLPAAMRAAGVSFDLAPSLSWMPPACGSKGGAIQVNCVDAPSVPGGYIHLGVIGSAKSRVEIRQ